MHRTLDDLLFTTAPDTNHLTFLRIPVTVVFCGAVADLAIEEQQLDWDSATIMEQAQQRA